MPTEEVFTTPTRAASTGRCARRTRCSSRARSCAGLEVRFEGGRAVEVRADEGEELMRTHVAIDDGAARLGEVALVDADSRVGRTGLVFYDTLFDENAASHIALGDGDLKAVDGADELAEERHERGINHSSIHTDFMIGSRELAVSGVTEGGDEVPILRDGDWVL